MDPAASPAPETATPPSNEPVHDDNKHEAVQTDDAQDTLAENKATKKKKKKKKLAFGARVFARSSLLKPEAADDLVAQSTLNSARVKADYRAHGLRLEVEAELAGKPRIKTAFVQQRLYGDETKIDVRAGHFKMPFSAIQLDSIWTLPMADRGLIDNVLVQRLQVSGRAVGATVAIELPGGLHPELHAGVFQGSDDAGNPLAASASHGFGQDAVLRLSIQPFKGLVVGAAAETRAGQLIEAPPIVERAYAVELDATLDVAAGPGRVRAWLEAMIGTSWLVADSARTSARFVEGRGIAAYRIGGDKHRARYVELYGLAGALDPDAKTGGDRVVELTAGITYGASEAWRLQLEAERWKIGDAAPIGIAAFAAAPADSTTVLVQLSARI